MTHKVLEMHERAQKRFVVDQLRALELKSKKPEEKENATAARQIAERFFEL